MKKYRRSPLCTIYRITNVITGKVYVGQTWSTIARRWREHQRKGRCRKLAAAIAAYGRKSFRVEVVTFAATQYVADALEAHLITAHDSVRSGYNIREGGASGKLSDETKARMRAAHLGKVISEAQREKLRAANLGKKHPPRSEEWRRKMSAVHLGSKRSAETRARLSAAHLGNRHTPETRAKMSNTRKGMTTSPETRAKMLATRAMHSAERKYEIGQKMWASRRARQKERSDEKDHAHERTGSFLPSPRQHAEGEAQPR